MVFSSLLFLFGFLALNLLAYFLADTIKKKNIVLLLFSVVFYAWSGPQYIILLAGMSFWSWMTARRVMNSRSQSERRLWLIQECVVLLGLLGIFKYTVFFLESIHAIIGLPGIIPEIGLPIGISFYTFQLLSYVVDVYRGEVPAQEKFWKVLLYASLFHQCIAGPIVRYQTIAEELEQRTVTPEDIANGVRRFSVGLAKKAVLANGCASLVDTLIPEGAGAISSLPVMDLWLGMFLFMLQIYLDFSAYSDMSIGMGRMVGFHYLENFRHPYMACSVKDFWRRWHISLSSFFRDYVYIPLGGSRGGIKETIRNLFIVWFLTGMWHGASWNYILWGLYYFIFLIAERFFFGRILERIPKAVGHVYTVLVIYFGWVLFKFENMQELGAALKGMFDWAGRNFSSVQAALLLKNNLFFIILAVLAVTPVGAVLRRRCYLCMEKRRQFLHPVYLAEAIMPFLFLLISMLALVGNSYNPFLYFRF